jgi:hypothetical protein
MRRNRRVASHALSAVLCLACSRAIPPAAQLVHAGATPWSGERVVGCRSDAGGAPCAQQRDDLVIAVMPFDVPVGDTLLEPLAFGMADLLSTDLGRSRQLRLVERLQLGAILRELELARSGRVDTLTAPRVGRLLQARRLVLGRLRLTPAGEMLVSARISDVATGRLDTALVATARLINVLAAEKAVAFRLFTQLGVNLTPQERALVEQIPTRNVAALLAYGQGVRAEINGQYAAARSAFRRAVLLDPNFAPARERATFIAPAVTTTSATGTAIDRVNRPLVGLPATSQPRVQTDPSFPAVVATVIITILRP